MEEMIGHRKPWPAFIHLAAWGILLGLPFFFTGHESEVLTVERYLRFVIVPLSFMLVFYMNYSWLVKRYLFTRQPGRFLLANVLLIIGTMLFVHLLMHLFPPPPHGPAPDQQTRFHIIGFFFRNTVLYMLVAGVSVAIKMTHGWYRTEAMRKELEKSKAEAELQHLKSQLNPHFLFNTLNNIYSLIAFSPERAQQAVHDLSRLLRYVLYESSQPFVSLDKEIDFIRNYVELMRIRLPKQVELKVHIAAVNSGSEIAPLLFISLIENAFKHGVNVTCSSFIDVDIHQEGNQVSCLIRNSYFPKDAQDESGSGIGLLNLQKRLDLLYPGSYQFTQGKEGDAYIASLVITMKPSDE